MRRGLFSIVLLVSSVTCASAQTAQPHWFGSWRDALAGKPTNRPPTVPLYNAVTAAAGCKVVNVNLPSPTQSTWTAIYDPSCTPAQIAAGNAAVAAFKPPQ